MMGAHILVWGTDKKEIVIQHVKEPWLLLACLVSDTLLSLTYMFGQQTRHITK